MGNDIDYDELVLLHLLCHHQLTRCFEELRDSRRGLLHLLHAVSRLAVSGPDNGRRECLVRDRKRRVVDMLGRL